MAVLKASLGFFTYNILMAFLSMILDTSVIEFVVSLLPFRGTIPSIIGFLLFTQIDIAYLQWFQITVDCAIIGYTVFEVTQVTNLTFKVARTLKNRINFDGGFG